MEENNINKKKNYPSIPSNFVTLLQLQEKWNKEKEKQKQQQQQQLLKAEEQPIKSRRNNRNTVEKAVVAAVFVVENESTEKEVNTEELSSSSSKKNKKKKRKKWRNKKKEETQSRAKEEEEVKEEVKEGVAHAPPPVSTEKENVSVRRVWLKKGMRSEFRPKINNVAVVQSEGLASGSVVEIDRKFRDLSVKQSEGLESGSVVAVDRKFRDLSMNNRSGGVKNDRFIRGVRRGDWGYSGGGGGKFGCYPGERKMRSGPGVVWVKKGEIINANVDGNQSSSSSVKELE